MISWTIHRRAESRACASRKGPSPQGGLRDFLPAAGLLAAGLVGLTAGWLLSGTQSGQYLVVMAPTSSLVDSVNLVTRTGGRLAATSSLPNVVIAGSSQAHFAASLRKAGAWLAVSVPAVAGCGAPSSQEQTS
ncbi:hypothetical protein NRB_12210 [Novosphingobium sp. 11B]|jgi:hypothetical protein|uniref:Uncharacterized protein n=1 Tax=Novosphingobium resinovorum TaxID=158500 RepID=A0A031J521_9SPHN|nr:MULTISPECIES: hypothetical protein [Sphingomonadaceae]EZP68939.1 hypothetical protein BV97_05583 [Novosphingobium resinovorum]